MNNLYYDDKCPICINTVKFIEIYIRPRDTKIVAISKSRLDEDTRSKALKDMLYTSNDGRKYWGYDTYIMLMKNSSGKWASVSKKVSIFMARKLIKVIGKFVYRLISRTRKRCNEDCTI